MDRFQEIIWDLGEEIDLSLHVDTNNSCQIIVDENLSIQLEVEQKNEKLLIAAYVSEVPPGGYREKVLKETLKRNSLSNCLGTFAYIEKINMLILFHFLPLETINKKQLADFLEQFIEEASTWHSSISMGTPLPTEEVLKPTKDPNLPFI